MRRSYHKEWNLIRENYDVYFIIKVKNQKEILNIEKYFKNLQDYNFDKLLFTETVEGRIHLIKHINPSIHIDTDPDIVVKLVLHLNKIVLVNTISAFELKSKFENEYKNNIDHYQNKLELIQNIHDSIKLFK